MKRKMLMACILFGCANFNIQAQEAPKPAEPAVQAPPTPTTPPAQNSPAAQSTPAAPAAPAAPGAGGRGGRGGAAVLSAVIDADHKVTFRMQAPNAKEVAVNGQWPQGRTPMTQGENKIWQATVGPVPAGVWEYSFNVDGIQMIDPYNPAIKPMRSPRTSILHITNDPASLLDFQNVPHGTVRFHTYNSKSLGRLREVAVYTPAEYDKQKDATFPTMYLQHGSGDNHATWTAHGKAHWIVDNLIAQGKAKPMVIVMMDGHAAAPGAPAGGGNNNNTALFERDLLEDVMPMIESTYRVKADANFRCLVGLSMGGGQSLSIGLAHPDRFGWIGAFSASVPNDPAFTAALADSAKLNKQLKLFWIGCGKEDSLVSRNEQLVAQLKEKGINHEWHMTNGNHSWPVWRTYLTEFTPKLFQ